MYQQKILNLPNDLLMNIFNFLTYKNFYSKSKIKFNNRIYLNLYLITKDIYLKQILLNYNILNKLISKYYTYQTDYDNNLKYFLESNSFSYPKFNSNPILIDMLFTGCNLPRADSTFKIFNEEIFEDLKEVIKLFPSFINCNFGQLRCRFNLTPFQAACYNNSIPIYVIEYLLDNGANKLETLNVNGTKVSFKKDLRLNDINRYNQLKNLL